MRRRRESGRGGVKRERGRGGVRRERDRGGGRRERGRGGGRRERGRGVSRKIWSGAKTSPGDHFWLPKIVRPDRKCVQYWPVCTKSGPVGYKCQLHNENATYM